MKSTAIISKLPNVGVEPDIPPQEMIERVVAAGRDDGRKLHYLRTLPSTENRRLERSDGNVMSYHPTPKNASTSIKFMLADACGVVRLYDAYSDVPQAQQRRLGCVHHIVRGDGWHRHVIAGFPKIPIHYFQLSGAHAPNPRADIRFCVVRDPIERCASLYANRILHHGNVPKVSFDEFLEVIPEYAENEIDLRPQTHFLGRETEYYTHIFRVDEFNRIAELVSEFCGRDVESPRLHRSAETRKPHPTPKHAAKIQAIYNDDYETFDRYFRS